MTAVMCVCNLVFTPLFMGSPVGEVVKLLLPAIIPFKMCIRDSKCWSRDMLALCGISESQMPRLYESFAPVGMLLPETAAALGLPQGVTVCAGAGDNAAAAVGTGTVSTGAAHADSRCNISLGTSGTIFISSEKFGVDATNGLHAFAHADGGWRCV